MTHQPKTDEWEKQIRLYFYTHFNHINDSKEEAIGRICGSDCNEDHTLEDIEEYVIQELRTKKAEWEKKEREKIIMAYRQNARNMKGEKDAEKWYESMINAFHDSLSTNSNNEKQL